MGWIKDRIDTEYRKHKDLDWSLLAEKKILATLRNSALYNSSLEELWKDDDVWDENSPSLSSTQSQGEAKK